MIECFFQGPPELLNVVVVVVFSSSFFMSSILHSTLHIGYIIEITVTALPCKGE